MNCPNSNARTYGPRRDQHAYYSSISEAFSPSNLNGNVKASSQNFILLYFTTTPQKSALRKLQALLTQFVPSLSPRLDNIMYLGGDLSTSLVCFKYKSSIVYMKSDVARSFPLATSSPPLGTLVVKVCLLFVFTRASAFSYRAISGSATACIAWTARAAFSRRGSANPSPNPQTHE